MGRANPRQETLQWDEDVEEDEAMTIISKTSSDHHRSESSDSFVCVSEDTLNEARERQQVITEFDPLDPDGWGLVMPEAEAIGKGGEEEELEEEEDDTVDSEVDGGSSNSDWENRDD